MKNNGNDFFGILEHSSRDRKEERLYVYQTKYTIIYQVDNDRNYL